MSESEILNEQIAYYRARAQEYDEWFLRQGRYDRGEEVNALWQREVMQVRAELKDLNLTGDVLELACGTGLWTQQLLNSATSLTAVDSAPEMLQLNHERLPQATIRYIQADLFSWQPEQRYDAVFFSFWLSHVPFEKFESFWQMVRQCLKPNGRVFFVDSLHDVRSTASDHYLPESTATTLVRRLNTGEEYHIVKVFHTPDELTQRLANLGWQTNIQQTPTFFIYGTVSL